MSGDRPANSKTKKKWRTPIDWKSYNKILATRGQN